MPGRPRKPTKLKVVAGTYNVTRDRQMREGEPDVHPPRIPDAPDYLSDHERWAWGKMAEVVEPMRVTTEEDFAAFEMLACVYSEMVRLRQELRDASGEKHCDDPACPYESTGSGKLTYVVQDKHGFSIRVRPQLTALNEIDRKLLLLLNRFGLTPADRSRVKMADGSKGKDPYEGF